MTCDHKKVYSGEFLPLVEPLYFWICELCGEIGKDKLCNGILEIKKFALLYNKFIEKDNNFWNKYLQ